MKDSTIAICAAKSMENIIDRYKSDMQTLPAKKQRGAHLRAFYALPKHFNAEEMYARFTDPYWLWYVSLCEELKAIIPEGVA